MIITASERRPREYVRDVVWPRAEKRTAKPVDNPSGYPQVLLLLRHTSRGRERSNAEGARTPVVPSDAPLTVQYII